VQRKLCGGPCVTDVSRPAAMPRPESAGKEQHGQTAAGWARCARERDNPARTALREIGQGMPGENAWLHRRSRLSPAERATDSWLQLKSGLPGLAAAAMGDRQQTALYPQMLRPRKQPRQRVCVYPADSAAYVRLNRNRARRGSVRNAAMDRTTCRNKRQPVIDAVADPSERTEQTLGIGAWL